MAVRIQYGYGQKFYSVGTLLHAGLLGNLQMHEQNFNAHKSVMNVKFSEGCMTGNFMEMMRKEFKHIGS